MLLHLSDAWTHLLRLRAELRLAKQSASSEELRREIAELLRQTNEPTDRLRRLTQPKEG